MNAIQRTLLIRSAIVSLVGLAAPAVSFAAKIQFTSPTANIEVNCASFAVAGTFSGSPNKVYEVRVNGNNAILTSDGRFSLSGLSLKTSATIKAELVERKKNRIATWASTSLNLKCQATSAAAPVQTTPAQASTSKPAQTPPPSEPSPAPAPTASTPPSSAPAIADNGRANADLPDDVSGYQVHVMYVLASDGQDRELDLNGTIVNSTQAFRDWFAQQTGGPKLRFDTYKGKLDITFHRLTQSGSMLTAKGVYLRDEIERSLSQDGLIKPTKLYAVYYDGLSNESCGGGPHPPSLVGHVTALYLRGGSSVYKCEDNPWAKAGGAPGYLEFSMLHEIVHALGFSPSCGKNYRDIFHTSDSPTDLMYAGSEPWRPAVLDFGHDDYFRHGIPNCPDLANSAFLEPLPAKAEAPAGW